MIPKVTDPSHLSEARATQATLVLAAKKLAEVSPTAGTVEDVLEGRILGHYAEGLRQYLTIRLGSDEAAKEAFAKLREWTDSRGVTTLSQAPGVRARLYRKARELSASPSPAPTGTLAWFRADAPSPLLQAIHDDARGGDREMLELRHARGLTKSEIAFVLALEESAVVARLASAEKDAESAASKGEAEDLPKALLEAFALESGPQEISFEEESTRLPLGTVLENRYELEKHLGEGAFADVYRARDVAVPGHVVALKLLKRPSGSEQAKDAALKELRIIAAVFHPSIVQFKDHGWYEGRFWFVMPFYDGESLEERIEREPLTRSEAQTIFETLARALDAMHASGIRHQDIKPDNIFLAKLEGFEGGTLPILLDLGVAAKEAEQVIAGTPTYFAPEVAAQFAYRDGDPFPDRPIGFQADVFSLALSLRNALEPSTQPTVQGGSVDAFIAERANERPASPKTDDLAFLDTYFQRWLSTEPNERPNAKEFAEELAVLTKPEEDRARRMRTLRVVGPIAAALLLVFGVVAWELMQRAEMQSEKARLAAEAHEEALEDLSEAAATREQLEGEISSAQDRIAASQLGREELERQLAQAEARLRVTRRQVGGFRRRLDESQKETEAAQRSLNESQAVGRQRAEEVARLETAAEELNRRIGTLGSQNADARERVAALESERDRLQASVRRLEQVEAAQAGLERQLSEARASAQSAARDQAAAEAEVSRLENRIRQLEGQLASARSRAPAPSPSVPTIRPTPTPTAPSTPTTGMRNSRMARRAIPQ